MKIQIPELDVILEQQKQILEAIQGNRTQEWFNLEEACKEKGVNYNTTKNNVFYQPACGKADKYLHGRRVWHKSTITRWLSVTDDNRDLYISEILEEAS